MWLWIGLSIAATFAIDQQDDGGIRMVVEPDAGWEITPEPGLGLRVDFAKEGGSHMTVPALRVTLPAVVSPEKLKYVSMTTHFTACNKADGMCKPFELQGSMRVKKGSGQVELSVLEDATEHHAAFAKGPAERKADPAFEAADKAYFAAIDGGTPDAWEAFQQAQAAAGGVYLGIFGFEGCGPCKDLAREVLYAEGASVAVPWMLVNTMHPEAGRRYADLGVEGAPVVMAFDSNGKVIDQFRGYGNPGPFTELMKRVTAP